MKFADVAKGNTATTPVAVPWPGHDEPVVVLVRVIDVEERGDALAKGRAYAMSKGVADPKDGDELFAIGVKRATIAIACMDADAPKEPFFESFDEVRKLDPDRVLFLYEAWELHQDLHAPQRGTMSPGEYVAKVLEIAEATDPGPFVSMRPALLWSFLRILVAQQVSSWNPKSPSTSASETSISSAPSSADDDSAVLNS